MTVDTDDTLKSLARNEPQLLQVNRHNVPIWSNVWILILALIILARMVLASSVGTPVSLVIAILLGVNSDGKDDLDAIATALLHSYDLDQVARLGAYETSGCRHTQSDSMYSFPVTMRKSVPLIAGHIMSVPGYGTRSLPHRFGQ